MVRQKEKRNIYDTLLVLLIFLLGFGNIGGALRLSRIAAIVLLPVLVYQYGKCKYIKGIMWGLIAFYAFCLISLVWTPDQEEGRVELAYYLVHFAYFLEIVVFARYSNNALKSISLGWLLAVAFCCGIAYWEITTGNHLSVAKDQKGTYNTGTEILNFMRSNATFFNSNSFVTFLCYGLPWLVFGMRLKSGFFMKAFYLVALGASIVIALMNGSRGGLVSILIMGLIYVSMSFRSISKGVYYVLLLIPIASVIYYFYTNSMFAVLSARASLDGNLDDESRYTIWSNALKAFGDTYGFGTGIGGMSDAMEIYARGGVTITHNIFLEIMLQFGIVFVCVFVCFLWQQLKKALRVEQDRKMVLLMALVAFPVYGIINSGYLLDVQLYGLLATIFVFANYERLMQYKGKI